MDKATREAWQKIDTRLLGLAVTVFASSIASLALGWAPVGWLLVGIVDAYFIGVLILVAKACDDTTFGDQLWVGRWIPTRTAGIVIVVLLVMTSVLGFATIYQQSVMLKDVPAKEPMEALYASVYILGFGQYIPMTDGGRIVVLVQLATSILLLIGVFPLLISRVSTFDLGSGLRGTRLLIKNPDGTPLAETTVVITYAGSGFKRIDVVTDKEGWADLRRGIGTYTVTVTASSGEHLTSTFHWPGDRRKPDDVQLKAAPTSAVGTTGVAPGGQHTASQAPPNGGSA